MFGECKECNVRKFCFYPRFLNFVSPLDAVNIVTTCSNGEPSVHMGKGAYCGG